MEVKNLIYCVFQSFVCGPDKFILSVKFSFSINEKRSFYAIVILFSFVEYYFLSIVSMELV